MTRLQTEELNATEEPWSPDRDLQFVAPREAGRNLKEYTKTPFLFTDISLYCSVHRY